MGREEEARKLRLKANMEQRTAIEEQLNAKRKDGTYVLEEKSIARQKKNLN